MASNEQRTAAKKVATKRAVKKGAAKVRADRTKAQQAAADLPVSSAAEFKSKKSVETKLLLPGGQVCIVRSVGMQSFITRGLIPNALIPIVLKAVSGEGKVGEADLAEALKDKEALADMMRLADIVVVDVVVEPAVRLQYWTDVDAAAGICKASKVGELIPESERDDSLIYADEVDEVNKMFIFQYAVGGTRDLERFREQSTAAVANVDA